MSNGMLTDLLSLLAGSPQGMSVNELSHRLGAQPSAVAGMLETLERKGRLLRVGPDAGVCTTCGVEAQCQLLRVRGARYCLTRTQDEGR